MSYRNRILEKAYQPLKIVNKIGRSLGMFSDNSLRILNYHDVPVSDQKRFEEQLHWLSRSYTFVTPKQFAQMMSGEEPIVGHNLLISFDDGFISNRVIAEEVLNPLGISALFFVVSDFAGIKSIKESREFISKNIYIELETDQLPINWWNMGWTDLEFLLETGHTIGAHTMTHQKLSSLVSDSDLNREIIDSANVLEDRLGVSVDHFAFPFGNLASFSQQAMLMAKKRFNYVHSGLRGNNAVGTTPYTIRRDAAAIQHSVNNVYSVFNNSLLGAFLEGVADYHYAESRKQLAIWDINTISNPR